MGKGFENQTLFNRPRLALLVPWVLLISCSSQSPDGKDSPDKQSGVAKQQAVASLPKSVSKAGDTYQLQGCNNNNSATTLVGNLALYESGDKPTVLLTAADSKEYTIAIDDGGSRWLGSQELKNVKVRGIVYNTQSVVPMKLDESGSQVPMKMSELYSSANGDSMVILGLGNVRFLKPCATDAKKSQK